MPEPVKHPAHYTKPSGQVWDVLDEWFPHDPLLWQAGKYLARWDNKDEPKENLQKAIDYIQRRLDYLKAKEAAWPAVAKLTEKPIERRKPVPGDIDYIPVQDHYPPHDAWERK